MKLELAILLSAIVIAVAVLFSGGIYELSGSGEYQLRLNRFTGDIEFALKLYQDKTIKK